MLLIAGHHGSGKTTLLRALEKNGFLCFECSKIVQELYAQSGTKKELWDWVIDVRSLHGSEYLSGCITDAIRQVLPPRQALNTHLLAVSGIRGAFMRNHLELCFQPSDPLVLVWLDVQKDVLYKRYNDRLLYEGREAISEQCFGDLLRREEEYGLDAALMKPEVTLDNNGSIEDFLQRVDELISAYKNGSFRSL